MEDAKFVRATETIAQFGLFGPRSNDVLRAYTDQNLAAMPQWTVSGITIGNKPATLLKAQRMAESGWWLFAHSDSAEAIRNALTTAVEQNEGAIISDDLFEILRIEAGLPKAPNELNEKHNPLETTLAQTALSFTKGCYIGQEVIARLDSYDKVQRHMMGVQFSTSGATGAIMVAEAEIGEVTSVVTSPQFSTPIGLAYIRSAHANPGATISVNTAEGPVHATLVKLPFNV
jgi:folate-binding protein YgfZ